MIKVQRTSPTYIAIQYSGDVEALKKELSQLKIEFKAQVHTRIGDTEALYVMVEFEGLDKTVFVQKDEWLLFGELDHRLVSTVSHYGFSHAFKEVEQ